MIKNNLHTDALEKKYGPIKAIVLRHDPIDCDGERIRETKLVDESGILRTYALTFLADNNGHSELLAIDKKIKEGALMGQAFQGHGYEVMRTVLCDFVISLPLWMQNEFRAPQGTANARLIEFRAQKGTSAPLLYGTLIEIYCPGFELSSDPDGIINDRNSMNDKTRSLYDKIKLHLEIGAV